MTRGAGRFAALPLACLLSAAALPVFFLLSRLGAARVDFDASALGESAAFALGGALVSTVVGGAAGLGAGVRAVHGGKWLVRAACLLLAAPPGFWWIGVTRLPGIPGTLGSGIAAAAVVGGLALSPITMLMVLAALRELPSNLYEAARSALPPASRVFFVLLPLLKAPLVGAYLLTVVLLLGESEIPFLFGFRTAMTDVVTAFAQSFDVSRTIPLVLPLLFAVLLLAILASRPVLGTIVSTSRGGHGVVRKPGPALLAVAIALPAALVGVSLVGFLVATLARGVSSVRPASTAIWASVVEPVACAWITGTVSVAATYPVRHSAALRWSLHAALLLFCIPAAIYALGWIGIGHALGSSGVPPLVAHASRAAGLPLLGFAIAHSRLPRSLEDAARLVAISSFRRAVVLVLPLLAPSLAAAAALVAALTYADRDVASLLLPPGASRLMLDLYLVSANAPSAVVGAAALIALTGAAVTMAAAAAGPFLLLRRRG